MVRDFGLLALLSGGIALTACTTMGTGSGSLSPGAAPVSFAWKSKDGGTTGTMSARSRDFDPLWTGWRHGWDDWPGLATIYSGRVMANLQAANGRRMRCRFYLNDPLEGMAGGGQGQCQLASGRSVDAVFPRA